jgi:2-oxoglutarate dehydrogenase E1 component
MAGWQDFTGLNRGYVLELYDRFRRDPASVDAETRASFERWTPPAEESPRPPEGLGVRKIVGAVNLAQSIRRYGHLASQLDPLGTRPAGDPSLLPETHGVSEEDLRTLPSSLIWSPLCAGAANMLDVIDAFRRIYCSTTGYDLAHVFVPEERQWLRQAVEGGRFRPPSDPIDPVALLDRLTEVEAFERFLHRTFPGKTRFSIEGLDMLVPVLDEVIGDAAEAGTRNILLGMAHRGRLNVMAHVLNKPYAQMRCRRAASTRTWPGSAT